MRRFLEWSSVPKEKAQTPCRVRGGPVSAASGRNRRLSPISPTALRLSALQARLRRLDGVSLPSQASISWTWAILVLGVFGAALLTKEHTIVLPALILLTDFWWNPGLSLTGIKRNWKIYGLMALGGAGGVAFYWKLIFGAKSAGFALKEFTWYQYFFTQCRALFVYIREFVFPVWLTADWDFPISHNEATCSYTGPSLVCSCCSVLPLPPGSTAGNTRCLRSVTSRFFC